MPFQTPPKMVSILLVSAASLLLGAALVAAIGRWVRDRYGPMREVTSQCLICDRRRVDHWIWGGSTNTVIGTNVVSDWIDTFETPTHLHEWSDVTSTGRSRWFGGKYIGCGGNGVLWTIHQKRTDWCEAKTPELVKAYHRLVRLPISDPVREKVLREFTHGSLSDPDALIRSCPP